MSGICELSSLMSKKEDLIPETGSCQASGK